MRLDDSSSRQDLALAAVDDFTMQLSGPEWMDALPEDTPARRRMKHIFHNACGGCHNINFVLQNRFDEAGWLAVVRAMSVMTSTRAAILAPSPLLEHHEAELAAYLAEMRGPDPSPMEFRLLRHFMEHPGRVFSREQLLDAVWGREIYLEPRTVDVHVRRLRKTLNAGGKRDIIRTVREAGYALDSAAES